ncbi:unnamed protein product, partial [Choristocarpus tenellus]
IYISSGTIEATLQCDAGQECPQLSWEPSDCEPGTFQPNSGQGTCLECLKGYYCPSGAVSLLDCPAGSYCPNGTMWANQYLCPNGTYSNITNLIDKDGCTTCSPGSYCFEDGLTHPSGDCAAGFYCNAGSAVQSPDSYANVGYSGDKCAERTNSTTNDVCPPGHYCPKGSPFPLSCPVGTSSESFGLANESQCIPCDPGHFCPLTGATEVTEKCWQGYYCSGGDDYPRRFICPVGHYCQAGSAFPLDCPAGTYQNDTMQHICQDCPARSYCENGTVTPLQCPEGYYCPQGTEFGTQHPCPNGTYSNKTGLAESTECQLCPSGWFCGSMGLVAPEGLCGAGFYCALGASSPVPSDTDPSVAGVCAPGYACVEGAGSPRPVDGSTGFECPQGTYCPWGSSSPIGCPAGFYNPSEAMQNCTVCPPGLVCPGNSTFPEDCPEFYYCPEGSSVGTPCPAGTYGKRVNLTSASECAPCPAGQYCMDGNVTSECRAGYFCKTGADSPTPNSEYANVSYTLYELFWEGLDAGPCPPGHYCPAGIEDPVQCANATVRVELLGTSADDCGACAAGYVCYPGEAVPDECSRGYYCPQGEDPVPCPIGTYNSITGQDDQDDCLSCPAGYYCFEEGTSDYTQYPCPAGSFCLIREDEPVPCPAGTFRSETGASAISSCEPCIGGSSCDEGSTTTEVCPQGTYCETGSTNSTTCPPGFYCPIETSSPFICPQGYYCPLGSHEPTPCFLGSYCPEGAEIFTSCPLGWYGSLSSNNSLSTRNEACAECPPGTYGADPARLNCTICPSGYVCLGGTTTENPTSSSLHNGYLCPAGNFCPEGSSLEIPCPTGSHNPEEGSFETSACIACGDGFYQDHNGASFCLPCSSSSSSQAGSDGCNCLGLNRPSDGQCICATGYEYYDESGALVSDLDGEVDCQPIVYDRCDTGEALGANGECISDSGCYTSCGSAGGTLTTNLGVCECNGMQSLDVVCDTACRDDAAMMFVDPTTGLLLVVEVNQTEYISSDDLQSFSGDLYCSKDEGCSLYPVAVATNFSGLYGTGDIINSASSADRRLSEASPLEWGNWGIPDNLDSSTVNRFIRKSFPCAECTLFEVDHFISIITTGSQFAPNGRLSPPHNPREYRRLKTVGRREIKSMQSDSQLDSSGPRRLDIEGVEPTILNPLACIGRGDSILFDISSQCYPVYDKNSMLNTNNGFDYGEFRSVAEKVLSTATYFSFGFVFDEPGTYVFSSSCDVTATMVVAVMEDDVSCTTEAQFVPQTSSSLIALGIAKNDDYITLTPDWSLIIGLLCGLGVIALGVVSSIYYFRTKAWGSTSAPEPAYRKAAQTGCPEVSP